MKSSSVDIFQDLWKLVNVENIKSKLIVYFILVLIALPIEVIILPYLVVAKLSRFASESFQSSQMIKLSAWFVGLFAILKVISYFRYQLGTQVQYQMYTDVKKSIMRDIMERYRQQQKELPLGRFINHMDNVPFILEQVIYKSITYLIPEAICLMAMVVFLFCIDHSLGWIGLIFILAYISAAFLQIGDPQLKASLEASYRAKHNQGVMNTLDNMLYILISNSFDFETDHFSRNNQTHLDRLQDCEKSNRHFFKKLDIGTIMFLAVLVVRLTQLMKKHQGNAKKITSYTSVFVVILFFLDKLHDFKYMLAEIATYLYKSRVFLEDMGESDPGLPSENGFETEPLPENMETLEEESGFDNGIRLTNVSYRYPASPLAILHKKSLDFPAHSLTAIQGPSGCGKSTLAKILLGLLRPDEGHIYLGGLECSKWNEFRQSQIGYIPQQVKLFESSMLDNIRYTCRELSREYIYSWVKTTGVEHILKKNASDVDYLDRSVGVSGSELSGGQKQLVIILRTFLANTCLKKKKRIFILDEPTAALDPKTTDLILQLLRRMTHQYTIIVITHDHAVADKCDHRIVF